MEIFVFALGLAAAVYWASRSGRSDRRTNVPRSARGSRPTASRRSSAYAPKGGTPRFDERTAQHLYRERILTGRVWITDGDTLRIRNVQVRLFGIDAPELNHPYGKKAKWALHALCKGHTIRAEITDVDKYGRTVARCYLPDGRDLSAEMVSRGLALDWPKFSGGKYRKLETPEARKKLYLADARQRGRMHVWDNFEAKRGNP